MRNVVMQTNLPGADERRSGKVRDIYVYGNKLLIVATDRISAFDVILPNGIPDKGQVLTQMSLFWFDCLEYICPNHVISACLADFPAPVHHKMGNLLDGRTMWCEKADVLPVEAVVRGYLAGSGWKDYQATGAICGHRLPPGLAQSAKLPEPILTPATKAQSGHDENITRDQMVARIGLRRAQELEEKALRLYAAAAKYAEGRGLILADTKFEFGLLQNGKMILIDEVLTPDSSRFWDAATHQPGQPQPNAFDKQYVRDYLEGLAWDKRPPGPVLPDWVVAKTSDIYRQALERLTANAF